MMPSRILAEFVADLKFQDLPSNVVTRLQSSVLDTLGCGLYGSSTPWGRIISDYAGQTAGRCPIWGNRRTSNAAGAALANATMVHSFELDDLHTASRSHPGGVTIPVALALAHERQGVDGKKLIAAIAAGYEVTTRVGLCQGVSSFNRGWHPTGTAGVLGAAATASNLLGLSAEQTRHALGISGTMPAGLMAAQYGAMVKRLFAGHAAFVGVMAADLASKGFTGIPDLFEAPFGGYPKALSDDVNLDALTEGLGHAFEAGKVGYKFYPCVGASHTSLDSLRDIMNRHKVKAEDVASVTVTTSEYQKLHAGWAYEPSTIMAAQMNLQFCLATMLLRGRVFVDEFTDESIRDPVILDLIGRIHVAVNPNQDASDRSAKVDLVLRDGTQLSAEREVARGHPSGPACEADLIRKFGTLARRVLPMTTIKRIAAVVADLPDLEDITVLERHLTACSLDERDRRRSQPAMR